MSEREHEKLGMYVLFFFHYLTWCNGIKFRAAGYLAIAWAPRYIPTYATYSDTDFRTWKGLINPTFTTLMPGCLRGTPTSWVSRLPGDDNICYVTLTCCR